MAKLSPHILFMLFSIYKRRVIICAQMLNVLCFLFDTKWRAINKYKRKLRERKRRGLIKRTKQPARNQGDVSQFDMYETTGIFEDTFEDIFDMVRYEISRPREHTTLSINKSTATGLNLRTRLHMVLHWLRHYPRYATLKLIYHISPSQISRDINHIIPILYSKLHYINWPTKYIQRGKFGTSGTVDCTSHYRWRVHPRQSDYYRGDKHAHFITAQVC